MNIGPHSFTQRTGNGPSMNMFVAKALSMASLSFACATAIADQCRFSSDRSTSFSGTIKRVVISAEAGHLKVSGNSSGGINAKGRACASSEGALARITLESRREVDTVYLTVTIGGGMSDMFSFNRYAALDLEVTVPKGAQLNITDTSGDIALSDVGSSTIVDQSGDLLLKNITGDLEISDEVGEVRVTSVGGNVRLKDGSGNIEIDDVRGNVRITQDTSGDISVTKVGDNAGVIEDGAGNITFREIANNVTVGKDGSGGINVSEIGGDFIVTADSTGSILHDRVRGSVHIPAKP
jgi:hypothetical protein